ncbi:MAG: hypothetical protein KME10_22300 [Plectolyngbya sp. WJT66-NPBG17]|jgi:hypothetical protein|nr:hypothetical protein [Plectolyngbya sp. WJT66-NPBG17]MBW4525567.1 hypothetical protein [Phormidium tanganyikae FI6-MK23]
MDCKTATLVYKTDNALDFAKFYCDRHGINMTKKLRDSVPCNLVEWVRSLEFGIFELDSLLIHGSTVSVSDKLPPETLPIQMLDLVMRVDVNSLFCGLSGLTFEMKLSRGV